MRNIFHCRREDNVFWRDEFFWRDYNVFGWNILLLDVLTLRLSLIHRSSKFYQPHRRFRSRDEVPM